MIPLCADNLLKCGFVAIIGRPNVGKSTLVNALLGTKVTIVSPKPQTTRTRIHGIINEPGCQVVLMDTPGYCKARGPLTRALRQVAGTAAADADITLALVQAQTATDGSVQISEADREVLNLARGDAGKLVIAINKIDLLPFKEALLPWMAAFANEFQAATLVPISALNRDGLDVLMAEFLRRLPTGPALFPTDLHTDQAERFICTELIREVLLYETQEEVPHSAVVTMECFEDYRDAAKPICHLEARVYVERDSQKAIVIGRGGHQIKAIGRAARLRIEELLGCRVFLKLTAHVDKGWTTNDRALRRYGLSQSGIAQ